MRRSNEHVTGIQSNGHDADDPDVRCTEQRLYQTINNYPYFVYVYFLTIYIFIYSYLFISIHLFIFPCWAIRLDKTTRQHEGRVPLIGGARMRGSNEHVLGVRSSEHVRGIRSNGHDADDPDFRCTEQRLYQTINNYLYFLLCVFPNNLYIYI